MLQDTKSTCPFASCGVLVVYKTLVRLHSHLKVSSQVLPVENTALKMSQNHALVATTLI